jgi:pectin methylesterase-like acyl-CoA thioesterase
VCVGVVPAEGNSANNKISRSVAVGGKTLRVPGEYSTIQNAVAAADPGDTIQIVDGTYVEDVKLDKSHLKLIGADK